MRKNIASLFVLVMLFLSVQSVVFAQAPVCGSTAVNRGTLSNPDWWQDFDLSTLTNGVDYQVEENGAPMAGVFPFAPSKRVKFAFGSDGVTVNLNRTGSSGTTAFATYYTNQAYTATLSAGSWGLTTSPKNFSVSAGHMVYGVQWNTSSTQLNSVVVSAPCTQPSPTPTPTSTPASGCVLPPTVNNCTRVKSGALVNGWSGSYVGDGSTTTGFTFNSCGGSDGQVSVSGASVDAYLTGSSAWVGVDSSLLQYDLVYTGTGAVADIWQCFTFVSTPVPTATSAPATPVPTATPFIGGGGGDWFGGGGGVSSGGSVTFNNSEALQFLSFFATVLNTFGLLVPLVISISVMIILAVIIAVIKLL